MILSGLKPSRRSRGARGGANVTVLRDGGWRPGRTPHCAAGSRWCYYARLTSETEVDAVRMPIREAG
jgi:hypothetical protein